MSKYLPKDKGYSPLKKKKFQVICVITFVILISGSLIYNKIHNNKMNLDVFDKLNTGEVSTLDGNSARYTKLNNSVCSVFGTVYNVYDEYFLTYDQDNGTRAYRYNLSRTFDNGENCEFIMKIEDVKSDARIVSIPSIVKSGKPAIYVLEGLDSSDYINYYFDGTVIQLYKMTQLNENAYSYKISSYTLDSIKKSHELYLQNNNQSSQVLKPNSLIYQIGGGRAVYNGDDGKYYKAYLNETFRAFDVIDTDEVVVDLNGAFERIISDKAIITTNMVNNYVYVYGDVDPLCHYYRNSTCEQGFVVNEDLTKRIDDIVFIDDSYVVFKDGSTYLYENY